MILAEETLARMDEFAFVLLGGLILLIILVIGWSGVAPYVVMVEPENKTIYMERGSYESFELLLNGSAKNVTLKVEGEAKDWIQLDRYSLDLEGAERVKVEIMVPRTATPGEHTARIKVRYYGTEKEVNLKIIVAKKVEERREINFGDFTISYLMGEFVERRENFKVERNYFFEKSRGFVAILDPEIMEIARSAYLYLVIDDTNMLSNLIIEFNGKKVFDKKVGQEELIIEIPVEELERKNRIRIRTSTPGIFFWATAWYQIKEASLVVEYNGTFFKKFEFSVDASEIENLKEVRLQFEVEKYDAKKLNDMIVKINGKEVFRGVPTLVYFNQEIDKEALRAGKNEITFSVEPDTFYALSDVSLEIVKYSYES